METQEECRYAQEGANAGDEGKDAQVVSDQGIRVFIGDDSAYALESSSDGQEMFFNYYGDNGFYVSHNYGANWEKKTSSNITQWYLFDSSSTGQKVIASANDNSGNNYLYSSSDYGNTWTKNTAAGARSWYDVSSSSDGTKLAAAVYGGYIYMSSDSGTTWTQNNAAGSRNWYATDSSNDGNTLAAIVYGGYIYVTNNSGQSWTEKTSLGSKNWYDIALSGDGKYMIAAADYIYVSSDYGVTWNSISALGSKVWYHVDVSEEGLKMAAAVYGGFVYFSQDSGLTWTDGKSAKSWGSVDLNSNSIFAHNLNFQNLYYSNNNCAVAYISKPDGSCCQRESDYVFCNRFSYCGQNVKLLAIDNCDSERYVDCSTCQP
ncbi:MAG: hypothetical protein MUF50_03700 [Planctomycetes bacterium]|nr:hypothetical protein [Planctomycetota bacterium]